MARSLVSPRRSTVIRRSVGSSKARCVRYSVTSEHAGNLQCGEGIPKSHWTPRGVETSVVKRDTPPVSVSHMGDSLTRHEWTLKISDPVFWNCKRKRLELNGSMQMYIVFHLRPTCLKKGNKEKDLNQHFFNLLFIQDSAPASSSLLLAPKSADDSSLVCGLLF